MVLKKRVWSSLYRGLFLFFSGGVAVVAAAAVVAAVTVGPRQYNTATKHYHSRTTRCSKMRVTPVL